VVSFTPRPLYHRERVPGTHWIGGWVDLRASLDDVEKRKFLTLQGLELRYLGLARSQSLYRLRYPGSNLPLFPFKFFPRLFLVMYVMHCRPNPTLRLYPDFNHKPAGTLQYIKKITSQQQKRDYAHKNVHSPRTRIHD
jgi:hypothetical protein